MTRPRRLLFASVSGVAILAGASAVAHADIPVIDFANIGEWVIAIGDDAKNYALELKQELIETEELIGSQLSWVKQAAQYVTQLQQYASELQTFIAFVHNPSLGAAMNLLSMAGLGNSLPVSPYAVISLVDGVRYGSGGIPEIQGVLGTLSGMAASAYSTAHVYTPTDGSWASQQIIARGNGIAGQQGAAQAVYQDLQNHQAALQALRDHLATANTPKDVQDTQAQIELETTWTTNEAAQLQAISAAYHAQSDSIVQRDNEKLDQDIEGFVSTSPTPNP